MSLDKLIKSVDCIATDEPVVDDKEAIRHVEITDDMAGPMLITEGYVYTMNCGTNKAIIALNIHDFAQFKEYVLDNYDNKFSRSDMQ